jgi:hypothetical protein
MMAKRGLRVSGLGLTLVPDSCASHLGHKSRNAILTSLLYPCFCSHESCRPHFMTQHPGGTLYAGANTERKYTQKHTHFFTPTHSRKRTTTDTCHRAGCCVAYHLLGGSSESARLAAQDLFSLAMSSCPEQLTGALSAAVGAMEHLSLFPEEALAAYRTAARLDPARWGRERSKAECFARVFKVSDS